MSRRKLWQVSSLCILGLSLIVACVYAIYHWMHLGDNSAIPVLVSRVAFARSANIRSFVGPYCSETNFAPNNFQNMSPFSIVFVCDDHLHAFVAEIVPNITVDYILITMGSDRNQPYVNAVEGNPHMKGWFMENLVQKESYLQSIPHGGIPLGLDYHTAEKGISFAFGNGISIVSFFFDWQSWLRLYQSSISQELEFHAIVKQQQHSPNCNQLPLVYSDWQFNAKYSKGRRLHALEALKDNQNIHWAPYRTSRPTGWQQRCEYIFELSPPGNGADCHRTWEALALGKIVIVPKSELDSLYAELNLPVVVVDADYQMITKENLAKWQKEMHPLRLQMNSGWPIELSTPIVLQKIRELVGNG